MSRAGALVEAVAFDELTGAMDAFGGTAQAWTERVSCRAEWIYGKGDETLQAARNAGRKVYKIKIRSSGAARAITEAYRMRDTRRSLPSGVDGDALPGNRWNVIEVDSITNRAWVFVSIEGPTI